MQNKQPNGTCSDSGIVMERNRYFTGKYMTARDFSGEQSYFLNRHRLHNRLLHGWGIVCGLRVLHHPDENCRQEWVVVRAGIAIDCYGREIVLPKDTTFKLPPLPERPEADEDDYVEEVEDESAETAVGQKARGRRRRKERQEPPANEADWTFLLGIHYSEKEIEPVPVLYNEGECDPTHQEANRLREEARLVVLRWDEVAPGCWRVPGGAESSHCHDDCDEPLPGPTGICLEPDCPCGYIVPLARLIYNPDDPEAGFEIDTNGRRQLPLAPELHTHITHINWPHGQTVTVKDIRDWGRQFKIHFDRPLLPPEGDMTGVNHYTFIVKYGGIQHTLELLPGTVELSEDRRVAIFTIAENFSRGGLDDLVRNAVYITLKCDFILDCHGNPVDGNHLRGRLPSGNGTLGDAFESWFYVDTKRSSKES
jgi:hypothetical protein